MRYLVPLACKLGLLLAVVGLLLPLVRPLSLPDVLVVGVALWALSWLLGDLLVLPAAGPAAAAATDGLLALALGGVLLGVGIGWALLGVGAAVAVVEYCFHDALLSNGLVRRRPRA